MGKIAFLGDSITKATDYGGVVVESTFAYKIGIGAGFSASQIINAGVSSDKVAGMVTRLEADVFSKGATVCCCMPMANDAYSGTSILSFKLSLKDFVTKCRLNGVKPVFISPPLCRGDELVMSKTNAFLSAVQEVAGMYGTPLIDYCRESAWAYLWDHSNWSQRYVDSIHQTALGNASIAEFALRPINVQHLINDASSQDPLRDLALASADYALDPSSASKLAALHLARSVFA
jgi:hypothetical protein